MIHNYFPEEIRNIIKYAIDTMEDLEEIRLRCENNIVFCVSGKKLFIDKLGVITNDNSKALKVSKRQLDEIINLMTRNSIYAMQDEIKKGFITLKEGCRVGLCGKCVIVNGKVELIKNISSINIRIAREVKNCGLDVFQKIYNHPKNLLIISPPGHGKTTLLRDIIRIASDGGANVSIVDERCELSPMINEKPVFDVGINTDVLSDLPKSIGINMVLRSMNPEIIATDEIATNEDFEAIFKAMNSGVKIFATFHGDSKEDYFNKFGSKRKILFDNYIYIDKDAAGIRRVWYE